MFDKLKKILNKKAEPTINEVVDKVEPAQPTVNKPEKKTIKKKTAKKKAKNDKKPKNKKVDEAKQIYAEKMMAKELATKNGEPWVDVIELVVDPNDVNRGSFKLDWNDKFVLNLVKQGYKYKETDSDDVIVDRWYSTVCRNVALELYEQEMADPEKRRDDVRVIKHRDLGNGRTEVS